MALPQVALQVLAVCLKVVAATASAPREKQMVNLLAPWLVSDANSSEKPLSSFCRGRRGRDFSGGDVAAQRARRRKLSCSARNQIVHCTKILKTPFNDH